ncbi:MAG: response regulator transcription factor [Actinomycetota bacterium]
MSTVTHAVSVLVVEDAPEFRQLLDAVLVGEGYDVSVATDGSTAIEAARTADPDVIVLDLGLPDIDGIEVCRRLREFTDAYIVMLTGRDDEVDRLLGLTTGADDYMTKPFSPRELVARIQVLMRRPRSTGSAPAASAVSANVICAGDVEIDTDAHEVRIGGVEVDLTRIEFDLLVTLAGRPTMVFSRQMLLDQVWGTDWYGDDHVVDVHIANLRKKIDRDGVGHIRTVRGVGYRLA